MYDAYAPTYETIVRELGYGTPAKIEAALIRAVGGPASKAEASATTVLSSSLAVDLGCGTGLSGAAVRERCCGRLVGCDLSARMLGVAVEKQRGTSGAVGAGRPVYDALTCCDAVAFLRRAAPGSADLVVACEVLVYMPMVEMVATRGPHDHLTTGQRRPSGV